MCGRFFRKRRSQTYDSIIELDVIELLRARFADEHDLPPSTVVSALGGALALRTRRRTQRRSPEKIQTVLQTITNRLTNHPTNHFQEIDWGEVTSRHTNHRI